jgi:hypothetical protein
VCAVCICTGLALLEKEMMTCVHKLCAIRKSSVHRTDVKVEVETGVAVCEVVLTARVIAKERIVASERRGVLPFEEPQMPLREHAARQPGRQPVGQVCLCQYWRQAQPASDSAATAGRHRQQPAASTVQLSSVHTDLSDGMGLVTELLHVLRHERFLEAEAVRLVVRNDLSLEAVADIVPAGVQSAPRGTAAVHHVVVAQDLAGRRQAVDDWRFDV